MLACPVSFKFADTLGSMSTQFAIRQHGLVEPVKVFVPADGLSLEPHDVLASSA
jgi:hypothetical protein